MTQTAVGARLRCGTCGTEIIVVKGTDEEIACCGEPMSAKDS
jgi:hypothetical protein